MAQKSDITLYTTQTPNGIKISITLEELGYVVFLQHHNLISLFFLQNFIILLLFCTTTFPFTSYWSLLDAYKSDTIISPYSITPCGKCRRPSQPISYFLG